MTINTNYQRSNVNGFSGENKETASRLGLAFVVQGKERDRFDNIAVSKGPALKKKPPVAEINGRKITLKDPWRFFKTADCFGGFEVTPTVDGRCCEPDIYKFFLEPSYDKTSTRVTKTVEEILDEAKKQFMLMREDGECREALLAGCKCVEALMEKCIHQGVSYRVFVDEDTKNITVEVEFEWCMRVEEKDASLFEGAVLCAKEISFECTGEGVAVFSIVYPSIWESKV